jgi:quinol monooxygenase YgiN
MSDAIYWSFEFTINEGKSDELEAIMNELVSNVSENEAGTSIYDWTISDDKKTVHVLERYANSDAVMTHLAGFGKVADRFMGAVTPTRFVIYGNPNDTVREALAGFGPTYFSHYGGFFR